MDVLEQTTTENKGWMDTCAMGLSFLCAVHCMITPLLVALLPVFATTFLVNKDFHLWMLLLVVPMAGTSLFLGCRKHKSRLVMISGALGVATLTGIALYESFVAGAGASCEACPSCATFQEAGFASPIVLINLLGGAFLIVAHSRNFLLCRKAHCSCG